MNPPQEVKDLAQRSAALQSSIPFRSNHPLAQPMFEAQRVPFPGETPAVAPGADQGGDSGQAAAPTTDKSLPENIVSSEDGNSPPGIALQQEGGGDGDVNVGLIVGPIVAAVVLVGLGVLAAVFVRRRRAKQRRRSAADGVHGHQVCRPFL